MLFDSLPHQIGLTLQALTVVQVALAAICGAIVIVASWTKRVAVKHWAVLALPVGSAVLWIAAVLSI